METEARTEDRRPWRRGRGKETAAAALPRFRWPDGLGFRAGRRERESRFAAAMVWEAWEPAQ